MEKEEFLAQLKKEHDSILDILLKMSRSLMLEEVNHFRELLKKFNEEAGPHFRFDEEAVYPSLVDAYYPGYLAKLYTDHDLTIARYNELKKISSKPELNQEDFYNAMRHVRMMSQYISNCEILPISCIPLSEQQIKRIKAIYKKSRLESVNLNSWAISERNRKLLFFN
jgi:hemerythrin